MRDGLTETGYGKITILGRSRLSQRVNEGQAQSQNHSPSRKVNFFFPY